jgi:putative RecB family exonuclease
VENKPLIKGLSASACDQFKQCPKRFKLQRVDKIPDNGIVWQAFAGTFGHEVLETVFQMPRKDRNIDVAKEVMREKWPAFVEQPEYPLLPVDDKEIKSMIVVGVRNLLSYPDITDCDVLFNEFELDVVLDGVPFKGFVDMGVVDGDGWVRVVDFKFGKAPRPQDVEGKLFQPALYAAGLIESGVVVDEVELLFVREDFRCGAVVTESFVDGAKGRLRAVWDAVNDPGQEWKSKTGPLCNWCPYGTMDLCPEGLRAAEAYRQRKGI